MDRGERDNEDEPETGDDETSGSAETNEAPANEKRAAPSASASGAKSGAPKAASAPRAQAIPLPPAVSSAAGLGKTLGLFVGVVGAIALLIMLVGAERAGSTPEPKWKVGDTVDVELTLVSTDKSDLACASGTEVGGKHCAFESQNKPWSKGNTTDDKTLKPYATVERVNLLAAGVWSQPVLEKEMPKSRFSLKCKYAVEGKMPRADVRWREGEGWAGVNEWYVGAVSDCKVASSQ